MEVLLSHMGATVSLSMSSEVSMEVLQSHVGARLRFSVTCEVSVEVLQSHVGTGVSKTPCVQGWQRVSYFSLTFRVEGFCSQQCSRNSRAWDENCS